MYAIRSYYVLEHTMVNLRESPYEASVMARVNDRLSLRGQKAHRLIKKAHATQAHQILCITNAIATP